MESGEDGVPMIRSCLAAKLRNINGKILGKDGKPMKAYRWVQFDASKQNVDPMIKEPCQAVNEEVKNVNEAADHANTGFYASLLHKQPSKKVVRISELRSDEVVEGAVVAIPLSAIEEVSARFENTLYGYFIGNRLAFPLMENYVKNTWAKFGLKRIMLDD
ncbi:hypothetical protein Tco_1580900, partial [Tanacetum coccineum]